jgi:hypothetical protein
MIECIVIRDCQVIGTLSTLGVPRIGEKVTFCPNSNFGLGYRVKDVEYKDGLGVYLDVEDLK